jgi:hypothetical protein
MGKPMIKKAINEYWYTMYNEEKSAKTIIRHLEMQKEPISSIGVCIPYFSRIPAILLINNVSFALAFADSHRSICFSIVESSLAIPQKSLCHIYPVLLQLQRNVCRQFQCLPERTSYIAVYALTGAEPIEVTLDKYGISFVLQGHTGILALHMCSIFSLVQLATLLNWHGDLILIMRIVFVVQYNTRRDLVNLNPGKTEVIRMAKKNNNESSEYTLEGQEIKRVQN